MPIEFRGNAGTPLQLLFLYGGVQVEVECASASRGARLRSVQENGFAQAIYGTQGANGNSPANQDAEGAQPMLSTMDSDFDNNDRLDLSTAPPAAAANNIFEGTFAFSGGPGVEGTVVTGVYLTSIATATSQGDCVFVGTLNRD